MNDIPAYEYKGHIILWIEKFYCYCILTDEGKQVREPLWGTVQECKAAIDSGEAM